MVTAFLTHISVMLQSDCSPEIARVTVGGFFGNRNEKP